MPKNSFRIAICNTDDDGFRSIYCRNPWHRSYAGIYMTLQEMWHEAADVEELMAIGNLKELAGLGAIAMEPRTPAQESKDMMALLRLALEDGCSMVFTYGEGIWEAFEVVPWLAIKWAQSMNVLPPDNPCLQEKNWASPLILLLPSIREVILLAEKTITERTEMRERCESPKDVGEAINHIIELLGDVAIFLYIHAQVEWNEFSRRIITPELWGFPFPTDHTHYYSQAESFEVSRNLIEGKITMTKINLLRRVWEGIAEVTVDKSLEECAAIRLPKIIERSWEDWTGFSISKNPTY